MTLLNFNRKWKQKQREIRMMKSVQRQLLLNKIARGVGRFFGFVFSVAFAALIVKLIWSLF